MRFIGFFFVVQNSRLRSIRAMYTGDLAISAVRRPSLQRAYVREVSKQTTILRLQGEVFFSAYGNQELTTPHPIPKASSSSVQSHTLKKPSVLSSKTLTGSTALSNSSSWTSHWSRGSICLLRKRLCVYTDCSMPDS